MAIEWLILDRFRRKLLWRWNIMGSLLILLLMLQSLLGQYTGIVPFIWLWCLLCVFPAWSLLLLSSWLNKRPEKLIAKQVSVSLNLLTILYLLLLFVTILLSETSVYRTGWNLKQYFTYSFYWCSALNLVLLTGYYISLFRQNIKRLPDADILHQKVNEMLEEVSNESSQQKTQVLNRVAEGELKAAVSLLDAAAMDKETRNHQILLKGQLTKLQQDIDLGVISSDEAQLRTNQLTLSLLNLIDNLAENKP